MTETVPKNCTRPVLHTQSKSRTSPLRVYNLKITLRAGVRAPETNSSEITSLKSIVCRRVAADAVELICCGRDYAEPVTGLPNG
jgi:hypothetical protein